MEAADEELVALLNISDSHPKLSHSIATNYLLHCRRACKKQKRLLLAVVPASLFAIFIVWFVWFPFRNTSTEAHVPPATIPINLRSWFDNQGVTWGGNCVRGGFDGNGSSYRAEEMPISSVMSSGVMYLLPPRWGSAADNIIANGQTIVVENPITSHSIHILLADDYVDEWQDVVARNVTLWFDDGSSSGIEVISRPWWSPTWSYVGVVQTESHFISASSIRTTVTQLYEFSAVVPYSLRNPSRKLTKIGLPFIDNSTPSRMHIFAISLLPVLLNPKLYILSARLGAPLPASSVAQIPRPLFVVLASLHPPGNTLHQNVRVSVNAPGWSSSRQTWINRIRSGDEAHLRIEVESIAGHGPHTLRFQIDEEGAQTVFCDVPVESGGTGHDLPPWYNEMKFGIAYQWGPSSIPAYAPPVSFAEWYWQSQHDPSNPTYDYHKKTYGVNFFYDEFIDKFRGPHFNASEWISLVSAAGAKFFVLTTKHHDGVALFDTKETSHRSTVALGAHRDFIGELMDTAKELHPNLKRGTYFSLPEWYNPAYKPYAHHEFVGGPISSAYDDSIIEPYTGYIPVKEFLTDIQAAQMKILAYDYGSDLMWCDLGVPSIIKSWVQEWWETARQEGREVALNNRCDGVPDYDTADYQLFTSIRNRKWEAITSINSRSYGYNKFSPLSTYRTVEEMIHMLVDIVSKNGNFLLTIGPDGDGAVPPLVVERLTRLGQWLTSAGDCIYNTTYSFLGAQGPALTSPLRFTQTSHSFCIISLKRPSANQIHVTQPLPLLTGDTIRLLGGSGLALEWTTDAQNGVIINVANTELDLVQYAWAFQIWYQE